MNFQRWSFFKLFIGAFALFCSAWVQAISPQAGLWVVQSELDGRPGRGITLDMQGSTLVAAVYAYERDGRPTFFLGSAPIIYDANQNPSSEMELVRYTGGRYFGSAALSGQVDSSPGKAVFTFRSGNIGTVTFPGETAKTIIRFNFAYDNSPDSLLGQWMFFSTSQESGHSISVVNMTTKRAATPDGNGVVSSSDGLFACEFQTGGTYKNWTLCVQYDHTGRLIKTHQVSITINDGEGLSGVGQGARTETLRVRRLTNAAGNSLGLMQK